MATKDPVMALGERSQRRGNGNFRDAYEQTVERKGEQEWQVALKDKEMGIVAHSPVLPSKKKAVKEAAALLLKLLGEATGPLSPAAPEVGASLNDEALIGDKVLGLCCVLWLRTQGITDKGTVTQIVAQRLSNEWLQKTGPRIGVRVSGWQTHRDGSLVEQRVWKMFVANDLDIRRTMEKVRPLFEDERQPVAAKGQN